MRRLIVAAMGLDLATWLLVPAPVRAAAESNVLATGFVAALLLKLAAILAIFGLLSRLRSRKWVAVALVVGICLVGAASNLRGVSGREPTDPTYRGPYTRIGAPFVRQTSRLGGPEVRESIVGSHPYPDPVRDGAPPSPTLRPPGDGATPAPSGLASAPVDDHLSHRVGASVSGLSSWYRYTAGEAAAGPALRRALGRGWRGRIVTVCARRCIRVRLTDWCACPQRLIDLDARSFAQLAPLSRGLLRVAIGY